MLIIMVYRWDLNTEHVWNGSPMNNGSYFECHPKPEQKDPN